MNTAQVLVALLKEYRVEYIFGVPGDTSMSLYDAFYEARDEITHVLARDERGASFMADAYARLAYKPGITEAPSGGGATYVVPGVAEANGSSVPMIVFTSDVPINDEGKGTLTAIDQKRLLEAATKWSAVVKRSQMLPDIIRKAFRMATSGRGGAVHVVLPEDVLHERAPTPAIYAESACRCYPSYRTQAPRASLERMLDALLAARRPVIVAGGGAGLSGAWQEMTRIAETLHIPVATTINGKGSIDEMHAWSIGVIGGNGGRPYANQLLAERAVPFWAEVAERAGCSDTPMSPRRVIDTLWQHTPADVVVVADPGTMTPLTAAQFHTRRPGRSIVIPRAHGGLGYALPATVGAAFARPSERIVGLVGDGSFGMSGMELATIASLRLPITIMLFNNASFGWIKMLQKLYHGERYLGVDFTSKMDAVAIAEAFGIRGVRITHPDQLGPAIIEAMESNEPTFIDIPTKSELEEIPPVHAWQAADQQERR
jgi:thiamine pyrophosphate-dependent acetolactate synthase large subunit-like protein